MDWKKRLKKKKKVGWREEMYFDLLSTIIIISRYKCSTLSLCKYMCIYMYTYYLRYYNPIRKRTIFYIYIYVYNSTVKQSNNSMSEYKKFRINRTHEVSSKNNENF